MSLTVSTELLEQAEVGEISSQDFLQCIRESLPYAWYLIEGAVLVITRKHTEPELSNY
jgi:hypothetical protein